MHRNMLWLAAIAFSSICWFGVAHAQTWGSSNVRLWGGRDGRTSLGCLTCDAALPDSLFGATVHAHNMVLMGNRTYPQGNPCAPDSRDPPALLDDQGNYYGRFSISVEYGHADSVCSPTSLYSSSSACRLVRAICQNQSIGELGIDPRRNLYFGKCDDGHKVTSIQNDGRIVIIDGTTAYRLSPTDGSEAINGWFTNDPVMLCPGEEMINPRRRQAVQAVVAPTQGRE